MAVEASDAFLQLQNLPENIMPDTPFTPDYAVPPGATIQRLMDQLHLTRYKAAILLRVEEPFLERLIFGNEPITATLAVSLSFVFGGSIRFWLCREATYRADLVRLNAGSNGAPTE